MNHATSIRVENHPFPFLLYLEWGLLAIAILGELLPTPLLRLVTRFPLITVSSIVGFGVMGLRLPIGKPSSKIVYTILEIGLIVLATIGGIRGLRLFPFLYIILVIRSCFMFRLPGRLIVTGVAFTLFVMVLFQRVQNLSYRTGALQERGRFLTFNFALNSIWLLGLVLLFVLLLTNALLAERESQKKLTIANDQLRKYTLRAEKLATAQERNRIAREIHDSLGHTLTALNLQLEGAVRLWESNPSKARTFLQEAKRLGSTTLQDVRQSIAIMRADPLEGQSLADAIAILAQDVQRSTDILPDCQIQLADSLPSEVSITVYRIIQEALTNICKHANATHVQIEVQATPTDLYLRIQDNGKGFRPDENQTGFGLQGMRERTLILDGQLDIVSFPGQGCCVTAHFPIANKE